MSRRQYTDYHWNENVVILTTSLTVVRVAKMTTLSLWKFNQIDFISVLVTVVLHKNPTSSLNLIYVQHNYIFWGTYVKRVRPCSYIMTNWIDSEWNTVYQPVTWRGLFPRVLRDILISGLILGLRQANERRRNKVTPSLIGRTQTIISPVIFRVCRFVATA